MIKNLIQQVIYRDGLTNKYFLKIIYGILPWSSAVIENLRPQLLH
jgi:hypothetical protein